MKAYRYKITLKGAKPPIWRRVEVPCGLSFSQFDAMIKDLFGFSSGHLSMFEFPGIDIQLTDRESADQGEQVMEDHYLYEAEDQHKFIYIYDFGDYWQFAIEREAIIKNYDKDYPTLIKYKGNNLIEDCGGIYDYMEILDEWKNSKSMDSERLEWVGPKEDYDFDEKEAQKQLNHFKVDESKVPQNQTLFDGLDDEDDDDDWDFDDDFSSVSMSFSADPISLLEGVILLKELTEGKLPETKEDVESIMEVAMLSGYISAIRQISDDLCIPFEDIIDQLQMDDAMKGLLVMIDADNHFGFEDMDDDGDDDNEDWKPFRS